MAHLSMEVFPAVALGGAHQQVFATPVDSRGETPRQVTAHVGSTSGKQARKEGVLSLLEFDVLDIYLLG